MELLAQGAEGRIFITTIIGEPAVIKERFKKKYRHPALDSKLTSRRIFQEARIMQRAQKVGIPVPAVLLIDIHQSRLYF
jgi:TP53 regulating kinase-like protein